MSTIFSRQETAKVALKKKTLHEWMIYEAENVVRFNFSDIAIHDKRILDKMLPNETRLWIIWEFGSQLLPMYCKLTEQYVLTELNYVFSAVEVHMLRFAKEDPFSDIQNKIARATSSFYFITKGYSDYDYDIAPTDFRTVMDLVFCGKANFFLS